MKPYILAFLFGILCLHFVREYSKMRLSAPAPWVTVGPWVLTDQNNQSFGSKDLAGKVVIASFFFTRCPTVCPKLMDSMKEVQKRFLKLQDKAHFISISIDPEFDTPEVLTTYAAKNNLNWTFLTGSKDQITQVVEGQMKFAVGNAHHVAEFALFDQRGDLRGKFDTTPAGMASLEKAAKYLIDNPEK
jgi:protein SCO1/2